MKNKLILISGVPGVGKTTLAFKVANYLNIDQVISTDFIREISKSVLLENSNPFLFSVTHESWKILGNKTSENIIRGSLMHARSIFPQLLYLIKKSENEGRDLIIEGVHLIPEFISYLKDVDMDITYCYLYLEKREEHIRRFDLKNNKRKFFHTKWYDNYDTIKIIDSFNLKEARLRDLSVLENNDLDFSLKMISSGVKNELFSC